MIRIVRIFATKNPGSRTSGTFLNWGEIRTSKTKQNPPGSNSQLSRSQILSLRIRCTKIGLPQAGGLSAEPRTNDPHAEISHTCAYTSIITYIIFKRITF